MIYNTTIASVNGNECTDTSGKKLIAVGNQNLYIGKNVYTDGKVIYGYVLPASASKSVVKHDDSEIIYDAEYHALYAIIPKNYAKTDIDYKRTVYATFATNNNIIICENELYEYYYSNGQLYFKKGDTVQTAGALANNVEAGDIGRNGGIAVAVSNLAAVSYIPPSMDSYKQLNMDTITPIVKSFDSYWDWSETIGINDINFLNVDDNGVLTVALTVSGDYGEGTLKTYTFTIDTNLNVSIANFTAPQLGDGVGVFGFYANGFVQNTGSIVYNNVSFPAKKTDKLVVVDKYVFVYTLVKLEFVSRAEIYMYDKTGTLLKKFGDIGDPLTEINGINNCRFCFSSVAKMLKKWGYVRSS